MSGQFHGVCVGGPYMGKSYAETHPRFSVRERGPVRPLAPNGDKVGNMMSIRMSFYEYEWLAEDLGFWRHGDLTREEALRDLLACYASRA